MANLTIGSPQIMLDILESLSMNIDHLISMEYITKAPEQKKQISDKQLRLEETANSIFEVHQRTL